jgi:hypothetical protein
MDNHPIPQDVTGFQFKLIGSMTVKQFGYVIFGVIMAGILYYLPLHSGFAILLKILFIPIIGLSGFIIAFLPVEGRPVDVMAANFIKALFLPNQFVYHKTGRLFNFATIAAHRLPTKHDTTATLTSNANKAQQLRQALQAAHTKKLNKLDEREAAFLQTILGSGPIASQPLAATIPPPPAPQLQPIQPTTPPPTAAQDALEQQENLLREQLALAKKDEQIHQTTGDASAAHQKAALLERQVQTLHFQRQQLEQQLAHLQNQLALQQKSAQHPATQPAAPKQPAPQQVKPPQQDPAKKSGLPHVPDTPNVIVGIVKDPRGNVLPNMLVEVKDKDGNPVRAFKTNALGQFASATPLAAGNYTVELEDPKKQNRFDVIQLAATNQILLPIEIISHDAREELRKQLFN